MKKALSILSASVLSLSLLAACTPATPSTTAAGTSTGTTTAGTTAGTTTAGTADVTYAVLLKNQSSDFWVKMKKGVEDKAKELGVKVDILAAQSEEDTEGQLKIMENLVNGGYAAIGVAPLSPVNLIPGVVAANGKGIYVMNIDEKLDMAQLKAQGGAVIGFATTDNVAVGKKGADFINSKVAKGSKVAIIEGKAGNTSGEARKQGATESFTAAGMTIVGSLPGDWDRQKALDVAASYIQQNADLKAIYCANDTMALGALQAVINANKVGEILVVGTDGDAEAVKSVEDGQLAATIAQDPAMIGAKSLEEMVNAVKNKITVDPNAEPKLIPIDSLVISK